MSATQRIADIGQSLWLDNLSRSLIHDGGLARRIAEHHVTGVTSNPAIFEKALATSPYYADDLAALKGTEPDPERRFEALAIPDIQAACDLLAPVHAKSAGRDGYVSLEVAPKWAHDTANTVSEALRLSSRVARPNLLIKVPGTPAGVAAFETLTAHGVNVNVTLLFSLAQTEAIFRAWIAGLGTRLARGQSVGGSFAVASVFMSRVDTLVDKRLEEIGTPEALALRGKAAVAMGKLTYRRYQEIFHGGAFADLRDAGARPQYPLWASTGTKNPAYSDLLYVEPLVGPESVNTLPDATLDALADHGIGANTVELDVDEAVATYAALEQLGIDMEAVGSTLQDDGVTLFQTAYDKLLATVA